MNTRERDEALHTIRTSDRHTVILVSLKCGAVGLNLTVCSRVILLDLWWNPAIEQQCVVSPSLSYVRAGISVVNS